MKRRRHWRGLVFSLAALVAVILFVLYSETGLRWGVLLLTESVLKPLSVSEVEGRLAGPFTLRGIEYADTAQRLSLERLSMDWKPLALLNGTAHITTLDGEGLYFEQHKKTPSAPPAEQEPFSLPDIEIPLKFIVEEAVINGITLYFRERTTPITITEIALDVRTRLNTLHIDSLRFHSDWLALVIKGDIETIKDHNLNLALQWQVPQQDTSPWEGHGTIRGTSRELVLLQYLSSPFDATLALTASDPLGKLAWEGRLDVPHLQSAQLPITISPAFSMEAELKAKGVRDTFTARSIFSAHVDTVGPVEGSVDASYADQLLQIKQLILNRKRHPARLEASGDISLTTPLRYQLETRWRELAWPLDTPSVHSESGLLNISGEDNKYQFESNFHLDGIQIPKGEWQLQAEGNNEAVTFNALRGKMLSGTIKGSGALTLSPSLQWQGKLQGHDLNPAAKWPQWPGRLSLAAVFSGRLPEQGLEMTVNIPSITGQLRDRKVQGHAETGLRRGVATLKDLQLRVGSAVLKTQGEIGDQMALDWAFNATELNDLLPQAQGSLNASGRIRGPRTNPRLSLQVEGQSLAFAETRAAQLNADIDLDLQRLNPSKLSLRIEQLALPAIPQQDVTLKAQGPLAEHDFTLESQSEQQSLRLEASAEYIEKRWSGTLTQLLIQDKKLGQWQLAKATAFSVKPDASSFDEICLNREEANLCANGSSGKNGLNVDLHNNRFPLQLFAPYLPQRFRLQGELNGRATLAIAAERPPRVEAKLTLGPGQFDLLYPEGESELMSLSFLGADLHVSTSPQGSIDGEFSLSLSESDSVNVSLQTSLSQGLPKDIRQHPVKAHLLVSLRDPDFISDLIPEVQNVKGTITTDMSMTGTLNSPRLKGYARFNEGRMEIPRAGLELANIQLSASGDNTKQITIAGNADSGDGNLTISGQLAPTPQGQWSLELAMVGRNFEIAKIPEARMQVSPNLKIRISGREIYLDGDLDIPYARLEPRDISRAVKPSDDVVIVGEEEKETKEELWRIHTRVQISAADSIRFIGYGYDGRIGGTLLLIDEPGSVTRARGVLNAVPGSTYSAFNTKLTISRGLLNFADSPVDNPFLDIKAARTIGDVIAGVNVSGTAKKPILTLYSEPPMDQADILSYLTLGHPVSSASQSEGEQLSGAAQTAGLVGGNYLAGYFGRQFGLEEARVEADPESQSPWVVVGKYLSPRLYIRYGVGVYEDAYSVILRYQLSEHWQVQGEGGLHSGGDIIYTFERP